MGKIMENIKLFFKTKVKPYIMGEINKLKVNFIKFYNEKFLPWIKNNWFEITNLSILLIIHLLIRNIPDVGFADFIIKTWILGILIYYTWSKVKKHFILK